MKTPTILLIESDAWLGELYQNALEGGGMRVFCAGDTAHAFTILDSNKIDLIIMDIYLPGHSGLELLHEIASYDDTRSLPVIILSASPEREWGLDKERWKQYGVVEYLYKLRIKPRELARRVERQFFEKQPQRVSV